MTQREIYKMWKNQMPDGNYDYWSAWEDWSIFIDSLCKDGVITEKQYMNANFPHKYGRDVKIRK